MSAGGCTSRAGASAWYIDVRPGLVVAITIPLVLADDLPGTMNYFGIGLHKISLGSLIIALGLLGGRRDHRGRDDGAKDGGGGTTRCAPRTFAYDVTAKPMLTGTLITAAGFLPIGLAKSVTGEYTFAIFAVTVIGAGAVVDRLGVFRAVPGYAACCTRG